MEFQLQHQFSSVQFSRSVVSDFLRPHESQHTRPPCPSPTPGVHSDSREYWSGLPFPSPGDLPNPGIEPGPSTFQADSLTSEPPGNHINIRLSNEHSGLISFRMDWLDLLACRSRDSQESFPTPQFKASILRRSAFFIVQFSHPYMTTGKTIALTRRTFADKVMFLLFNKQCKLVITFLPRSVF